MEILYTESTTIHPNASLVGVIAWLLVCIAIIICSIWLECEEEHPYVGAFFLITAILVFFGGGFYFLEEQPGPCKYYVTLNAEYSEEMLEENYKILDVMGDIYIIQNSQMCEEK